MITPSACDKSLVYRIAETTQIVNIHSCSQMGSVGQREHFFPVRSTVRFPGCAAAGMFRQAEPCRAGAGCRHSDASVTPFDEVEEQIRANLLQQKQNQAYTEKYKELHDKYMK